MINEENVPCNMILLKNIQYHAQSPIFLLIVKYRTYLIKRPGPSEWALIQGGCLLNFHHFQQVVCSFCNKTIHNITRSEDVPKQNFNCSLKVSVKYHENSVFREVSVVLSQFQSHYY